ncbi:hypothetical protein P879_03687 [Paragonimus westermani]|uniref:Uncharacterized protein n=1 Tax=Paragonimus westermani TaxID=34504 RepID=A0A8T0D9B3_9TREM|nr:hypothetical protein P879_03687 [Paragonimus westermani]
MSGYQLVRKTPRNPPPAPAFRDVTQGESNGPEQTEDAPRGLDVENYTRQLDAIMNKPKQALTQRVCAETVQATQSLRTLYINQRRDKLGPILAHEEACLNEELRDRFNMVINYP